MTSQKEFVKQLQSLSSHGSTYRLSLLAFTFNMLTFALLPLGTQKRDTEGVQKQWRWKS